MPQTSLHELHGLAGSSREFLSEHLMDFLEAKHTGAVSRKFGSEAAGKILRPAEALELEVKHKMSNAAHEVLQSIGRIEDAMRQNSELDIRNYLRYARENLKEAGKDLDAAEQAYKALEIYRERVEKASVVLGKELESVMLELFSKMEQLRSFQKNLLEKTAIFISRTVT